MKKEIIVSPFDERDYEFSNLMQVADSLPDELPAAAYRVRCQWFSSQCVAFACTSAMTAQEKLDFDCSETITPPNTYSPGSLYANREEDDYQGEGWFVRKALKQLHKYGVCLEKEFPFPESYKAERRKFLADKDKLLSLMAQHKIQAYFRCRTDDEVKTTIVNCGAVIVSAYIPTLFKSRLTAADWKKCGGHAFIIIGWDKDGWICQDSYSVFRPWGGKFHLSYDYPINEFWGIII